MFILLSLRTQYGNLGDLTINAELVRRLAERHLLLCLTAGVPDWYLAELRALVGRPVNEPTYEPSAAEALVAVLRAALAGEQLCLFMTPGDVSHPNPAPQRNALWLLSKLLPRMTFAQVGASYPNLDPATTRLLRAVSRRPHFLSVRDRRTRDMMAAAGIEVPIVPDLAFGLPRAPTTDGRRVLALSFRISGGDTVDTLAARLVPVVEEARSGGLEPRLYWQVAEDRESSEALSVRLNVPVHEIVGRRPDFQSAQRFYSEVAVICSNRLHALLIGAACGALPMAMLRPDEVKVTGSFECGGLTSLVSKSSREDVALLRSLMQDDSHSDRLQRSFNQAAERINEYFKGI